MILDSFALRYEKKIYLNVSDFLKEINISYLKPLF